MPNISLTADELETIERSAQKLGVALSVRAGSMVVGAAQPLLSPYTGLSGAHFAVMLSALLALAGSGFAVFWLRRNVRILKNLVTTRKTVGV